MTIKEELKKYKAIIENELNELLQIKDIPQKQILESMRYSLLAGGKRLRPILAIKACELLGGSISDVLKFACSIEMIHTYSLIHDDLPSMDDDDYRRGKLTNHKIYGEAIATLAGDGLLNLAFENILDDIENNTTDSAKYIKAFKVLSYSSGINGMIGGQVVDILSENKKINKETLDFIHSKKTSALIESSIVCGAIIANGSNKDIESLRQYGKTIGLCFQIRDDILDIIGDQKKVGKDIGSDDENNKSTYISIYGLDKSIEMTRKLSNDAKNYIKHFTNEHSDFFYELADYLVYRES